MAILMLSVLACNQTKRVNETSGNVTSALKSINCGSLAHFRGIQAVTDKIVWLSGTKGTVLKTENGGKKWVDITVPNCENLDFRDIHALDKNRAWVMSSGNGVKVFYTDNGGESWKLQFEDTNPKVFLDGMDFFNETDGVIYGDPINGVMDVLITKDGGLNWQRVPVEKLPPSLKNEAGFAASGTGVVHFGELIWMATGGADFSRIIRSNDAGDNWEVFNTPIKGGEGAGIFSIAFKDELMGVAVGGDYIDSTSVAYNCAYTADGGKSWELAEKNGPRGYRSCVVIDEKGTAVACGRTGIDKSSDFKTWTAVSNEGYYTADAGENHIWLAGRKGKVAILKNY